jgi:hypothetical protein
LQTQFYRQSQFVIIDIGHSYLCWIEKKESCGKSWNIKRYKQQQQSDEERVAKVGQFCSSGVDFLSLTPKL